jgi:UDP-3-O-[3-hydroxymyristoyl] N-acetylglucosamine deacetylase/3-hydroxyacyl-[acyl-carrier-protein] dehydratase
MSEKQTTIQKEVSVSGVGLHTGANIKLTFKPAPANHGYKFKRVDLKNQPEIAALAENVVDTSRGTTLGNNNFKVWTVEHVLAALVGMQVDNALIELDAQEVPIMDGSSKFYVEALESAGIKELKTDREYFELDKVISYTNEENGSELTIVPDNKSRYSVMIDYETKVLGTQNFILNDIKDFKNEIANCRTFVFLHELEFLLNNNLIKGGDLSNAIVFVNKVVKKEELDRLAKLFNKPSVEVLERGILNNLELRYDNEPARHKLLDVIGDLALVGMPVRGRIIASKPGHKTNIELAKKIRTYIGQKKQGPPQVDLNKKPVFDINQIKSMLPHRSPFLLVDKILEMDSESIIGVKNVTMNEPFFVGHFPSEPVMPAVLQIEAMAQTGGMLILSSVPDPQDYLTYFLKIDNVRLRNKVVPGDTLLFKLNLVSPIRRGLCHMVGKAYVGQKLVMEAEMLAQIVKQKK